MTRLIIARNTPRASNRHFSFMADPPNSQPTRAATPGLNPKTTLAMSIVCGGQPEVIQGRPHEVRAICHLEPPRQEKYAPTQPRKTLVINVETGRFQCRKCRRQGGVAEMLAITWKTSIEDAIMLAPQNLQNLTNQRPSAQPEDLPPPRQEPDAPVIRQYTPVLNDAYQYYRRNIDREKPYQYLYQLGINTRRAANAGIGYGRSTGKTPLLDHLSSAGLTRSEIASSHLTVGPGGQYDRFAGHLTIAEKDRAGAVIWYAGMPANAPDNDQEWSSNPPQVRGMPGHRPFMLGVTGTPREPETLVVTDDVRYFLAVRCYQNAAPVWLNDRRTAADAPRFAELVHEVAPQNLVMAFHDTDIRAALADAVKSAGNPPYQQMVTKTAIMRFVDSRRYGRDWSFLGPETVNRLRRELRTDRRREAMGHRTKYAPTSADQSKRGGPTPRGPTQLKILDRPRRESRTQRAMRSME